MPIKQPDMNNLAPEPYEELDDSLFLDNEEHSPVSIDKQNQFEGILKQILPHLGSDEVKIIVTQVMVALKLEGLIGKELTSRDKKMVNVIKDSILMEPRKKREALRLAQKLLR